MSISRRALVGGMMLSPIVLAGCAGRKTPEANRSTAPGPDWRAFDQYLEQRAAAGWFAGTVLLAKNDEPLLLRGYGLADRDRRLPNQPNTKFNIGSIGKSFTSVAIAQLVGQGKASFQDTIAKYVSGFRPEVADKVTIHQLLTHTSGLGDPMRPGGTDDPPATMDDLMRRTAAERLQFEPGTRMGYSSSGYVVLGAIVERIAGRAYADHIRDSIFRPAGMTDTDIRAFRPADIPNMAHGHAVQQQGSLPPSGPPPSGSVMGRLGPGGLEPDPSGPPPATRDISAEPHLGNPSGGAISTATDLLRFGRALLGHRILTPALTGEVTTGKGKTREPGRPQYAYGFEDNQLNGVRIVGHNGGTPGYEAQLDLYPEQGYTVAILTNQDQAMRPAASRSRDLLTR